MTLRLTSSSLAGTSRKLVAVGTARLASMLATMRAAAPRIGLAGRAGLGRLGRGRAAAAAAAGRRAAALGAGAGAGAAGAAAVPVQRAAAAVAAARPVVGEEVLPALAHRRAGRRGTARTSRRRATRWGRRVGGSLLLGAIGADPTGTDTLTSARTAHERGSGAVQLLTPP